MANLKTYMKSVTLLQSVWRVIARLRKLMHAPARSIDQWAGYVTYNNYCGFTRNIQTSFVQAVAKRSYRNTNHSRDELGRQLADDGFVFLDELYQEDLLDSITEIYRNLLSSPEALRARGFQGFEFSAAIRRASVAFPEAQALLNKQVIDVLQGYYATPFRLYSVLPYRTFHVPDDFNGLTEVYSDFWHFDLLHPDHIKMFVLLSEVTERNGPMHVIPRNESLHLIRSQYQGRYSRWPREEIQSSKVTTFVGPVGRVLLCRTPVCLHAAGIPEPGRSRDMIQFHFTGARTKPAGEWFEQISHSVT